MPKSKLSTELEKELKKRLKDDLEHPPVEFLGSLRVSINGKDISVGRVDAGFKFGSKIVLCEIETMGFPAANLARTLSFCHHTKEKKEMRFFHFFAPTPYFKNWPGGWRITTDYLVERLRNDFRVHYYPVDLEDDLPDVIRDLPENKIDSIVKNFVEQIVSKIKGIDKKEEIGIPWKSSR